MVAKTNKSSVGRICSNCAFSCFGTTCERKDWTKHKYTPLPKYGKDEVCPVSYQNATKPKNKDRDLFGSIQVSLRDTWNVCAGCQFASVKNNQLFISEEAFENHCMDCTVNSVRENLEEIDAEAAYR